MSWISFAYFKLVYPVRNYHCQFNIFNLSDGVDDVRLRLMCSLVLDNSISLLNRRRKNEINHNNCSFWETILYYFFYDSFSKICSSNGFLSSLENLTSINYLSSSKRKKKLNVSNTSCHYSSLFPDWNSSGFVSLMSRRIVSGRPFWSNFCSSTATVDSVFNVGAMRK